MEQGNGQIGKKDVPQIVTNLALQHNFERVVEKDWSFIALALNTPPEKVLRIREGLRLQNNVLSGNMEILLTKLVSDWVGRVGDKGTRIELSKVFRSLGLEQFACFVNNEVAKNEECGAKREALGNSLIIRKIFNELSFKDKKSFRLVNSTWLRETSSLWNAQTERRITKLRRLLLSRTRYNDKLFNTLLIKCHDSGQNLNTKDSNGVPLFFYAIRGRQNTIVFDKLIMFGVDIFQVDGQKRNALHWAVRWNNLHALQYFISKGVCRNAKDLFRRTPPAYYRAHVLW